MDMEMGRDKVWESERESEREREREKVTSVNIDMYHYWGRMGMPCVFGNHFRLIRYFPAEA